MLFNHNYDYKQFQVYSDQPVPPAIEGVLDLVTINIQKSELYKPEYEFNIFICHNTKLFGFLTRNTNAGGVVQGPIAPHVFLRKSDIENNEIIPPGGWLLDRTDRPLSYFISHELTHSLQAKYDRFMILKTPYYIMEGYGDYIGKANSFDYETYRELLIREDVKMSRDSLLYNRFHIYIAYLMEKKGMTFLEILESEPDLEETLEVIRSEG